ncbi:MAG: 4-(cytidine 5'-diphospho)-2-C-methyl-D-erythritol kinase, partial [Clostridia bacterium]|nr:4-(cytidine 5'-diphospho)-2-C-methyl-D-erythritol kinase [Clostridia bacterium]
MQTVSLCDELTFEKSDEIDIKCNILSLDCGKSNLCYRAAEAFGRHTGVSGMKLYLEKSIPMKAGLGGGSADAAAVLRALNRMYGCGLNADDLKEIGKEIGSDVPFCVEGGTAKATGRGEIIEELPQLRGLYFAMIMGGDGLSTADIYRSFDSDPDISHSTELMEKAIRDGKSIYGLLYNGLEKAASEKINVNMFKERFRSVGASDVLMSGSGAAIYGIFDSAAGAKKACESFIADGIFCVTADIQGKTEI